MAIEQFSVIAAAILALAGAYLPGVRPWYEGLDADRKQLVMLAAIFAVVAGKFGLGCLGKDATFMCTADGAYEALTAFVLAIATNAGVYKATNYIGR